MVYIIINHVFTRALCHFNQNYDKIVPVQLALLLQVTSCNCGISLGLSNWYMYYWYMYCPVDSPSVSQLKPSLVLLLVLH